MKKIGEFLLMACLGMILMLPTYVIIFLSQDAMEDDPDWWKFWKRRKQADNSMNSKDDDLEDWVEDLD